MSRVAQIPNHVAIVMDGNGRWATQLGTERSAGHRHGSETVSDIVTAASRSGIRALTLFGFSAQNWLRPQHEVDTLMLLLVEYLVRERPTLLRNSIRLRSVGTRNLLPDHVRNVLEEVEQATQDCSTMTLTLALSYGGQEEIVETAQRLARESSTFSFEDFERALPSMEVGPVDLLIRTGGEQRISNFLLWGLSYAELYFTQTLWPDFTPADLELALRSYSGRERRFGKLPDAASQEPETEGTITPCPL